MEPLTVEIVCINHSLEIVGAHQAHSLIKHLPNVGRDIKIENYKNHPKSIRNAKGS